MSFEKDLKIGQKFERELERELNTVFFYNNTNKYDAIDLDGISYEVKSELGAWEKTGNHYCEYEQYTKAIWKPSGVSVTDADIWSVALVKDLKVHEWINVRVKDIYCIINDMELKRGRSVKDGDVPTKGYLIPLDALRQYKIIKGNKMRELKIGESAISGRAFNVKRKMVGEHKIQEFAIGVSKKNKDGQWTNGFLNVTLWGDSKVEDKQDIGLIGRIEPENYTKKNGEEVKTFRFNANDTFTPAAWEKKQVSFDAAGEQQKPAEEEPAW